ncbi:ABC transporter permease [Peteryoungia desertarenae]|uniref:ABC transporter permease n=1 Tax=Peteryoungia desertarenae TaxID=1813451 RepID=A0ABX6QPH9_9HYPH|nr:ABC transporter permease [Peteryoungia desertarenae]QLF70430.1 ABC transporter permease [Peteryoungia desertarenae]
MLFEAIKLAFRAISRNLLRSFLTVLGVVIGVAAVIAMVTIGNGTTAQVTAEISKLGTNLLFVRPGQYGPGRAGLDAKRFTVRDIEAIKEQIPGLRAVAGVNQSSQTVVYGGESRATSIVGSGAGYLIAQNWELDHGRNFLPSEERGGQSVCIIGETVRSALFGSTPAIDQSIRVGSISCKVIGTLIRKGQSGMGSDQDDVVIMPLKVFQRRISGSPDVSSLMLSAEDGVSTAKIQGSVELLLRERRKISGGREDDFTVNDMTQMAATLTGTTTLLTGLLGAVAAVSLLVGGIGIMNIMLVSVTERTREIGIRLAIGALEKQVLTQFLIEAVTLSVFGGVVGILLGLSIAYGGVQLMGVPFVVSPLIVFLAFAFSAAIGMIFGYFPARRAAQMNPIEALRHE